MGGQFSTAITEAKEQGGNGLVIENQDGVKSKEIEELLKHLEETLPNLSSLTVNHCKVKKLPKKLGGLLSKLKRLSVLQLDNNNISTLPSSLIEIKNELQEFYISGNRFKVFPGEIVSELGKLRLLDFGDNNLVVLDNLKIPCALSNSLEMLSLSKNAFTSFPKELCMFDKLEMLNLSENQIEEIPLEIENLVHLKQLYLKNNRITQIPAAIGKLTQLEHLDLSVNRIKAMFPSEMANLTSLKKLELQHNQLKHFSHYICSLTSLQLLKLNDNKITELDPDIKNLTNLIELFLQENELTQLPPEIGKLASLRKLFLEYNKISTIPNEIGELKKLVVLILHHNQIASVCDGIRQLKTLLRLSLDDNPLDDETLSIIRKDGALSLIGQEASSSAKELLKYRTITERKKEKRFLDESRRRGSSFRASMLPRSPSQSEIDQLEGGSFSFFGTSISVSGSEGRSFEESPSLGSPIAMSPSLGTSNGLLSPTPLHVSGGGSGQSSPKRERSPSRERVTGKMSLLEAVHSARGQLNTKGSSLNIYPSSKTKLKRSQSVVDEESLHPHHVRFSTPSSPESPHKDRQAPAPSFSKFKPVFEEFLQEQDFSQRKIEDLNKLTTDQKWNLLKEYKSSTLDMLALKEKRLLPSLKLNKSLDGHEYVSFLKESKRITVKNLESLFTQLKDNEDGFVPTFIEAGGISALLQIIHKHSQRQSHTDFNYQMIKQGLTCLKYLLEISFKSVITTLDCVNIVALNISLDEFELQNLALEILTNIAEVPNVGHSIVMEALLYLSRHQGYNENSDTFLPLLNVFKQAIQESNQDLAINCLYLLITLIENIEPLEDRFDTRNTLIEKGLMDILKDIRIYKNEFIQFQLEVFEEGMMNDDEDMEFAYGRQEVIRRLQKSSPTTEGDYLQITTTPGVVGSVHNIQSLLLPYTAEMNINDIVSQVKQHFGIENQGKEYALYATETNIFLGESKSIADYHFKGVVFLILKMKPLELHVSIPDASQTQLVLLDPNADCATAVKHITSLIPEIKDGEDYGLFVYQEDEKIYLEDTKKLFDYHSLISTAQQGKISLLLKPRAIRIIFADDTSKTMAFEPSLTFSEIKNKILKNVASGQLSPTDYGLYVDSQGPEGQWLKEDIELSQLPELKKIRLLLRPRKFNVLLPNGDTLSIVLDFVTPVMALIQDVVLQSGIEKSDNYLLYWNSNDKLVLLRPDDSMRAQHVLPDSQLVLKEQPENEVETDINIWEEPTNESTIAFEDVAKQEVKHATLNKLVEFLTSEKDLHRDFLDVFLMMYKCMTTPSDLLRKLEERMTVPATIDTALASQIKIRVALFLKSWIENPYEKPDTEMRDLFLKFIEGPVQRDCPALVSGLKKAVDAAKKEVKKGSFSEPPPKPKLPKIQENWNMTDIDPLEMARQMTLKLFDIYTNLSHMEFFNQAWTKSNASQTSPNLISMITYFNDISAWIATSILLRKKVRDRSKIMEYFIKVAEAARELRNYHLLTAIISGFNNGAILRLKWTREKVSKRHKQTLTALEDLMSMQKSYKNYREKLKTSEPPCIPYIGVYLTDLVFIEDGNPDKVGTRINFLKQQFVYNIITTVQKFQKFPYNLEPVSHIQAFFNNSLKYDDKKLFELSLDCEPRGATRNDIH